MLSETIDLAADVLENGISSSSGRKRKRQQEKWSRNAAKRARVSGKSLNQQKVSSCLMKKTLMALFFIL